MLEPYAMKVARTVLMGGKPVRAYLSKLTLMGWAAHVLQWQRQREAME